MWHMLCKANCVTYNFDVEISLEVSEKITGKIVHGSSKISSNDILMQ